MELDHYQVNDFEQHWAGTYLLHQGPKKLELVYCDHVAVPGISASCRTISIRGAVLNNKDIEFKALEPYRVETGYYNIGDHQALYFSRNPLQGVKRGVCDDNSRMYTVNKVMENDGNTSIGLKSVGIHRTWLNKILNKEYYHVGYKEAVHQLMKGELTSYALGDKVCLIYNRPDHPPIVAVGTVPVGYAAVDQVYLHKDRHAFRQPIEALKLSVPVNLY